MISVLVEFLNIVFKAMSAVLAPILLGILETMRRWILRWLGLEDLEKRLQQFVCTPSIRIMPVWWRRCSKLLPVIKKEDGNEAVGPLKGWWRR
jgi:hypothetical protein